MKKRMFLFLILLSSFVYLVCSKSKPSEPESNPFIGITETDAMGTLNGNFDPDDWIHSDIFFNNSLRISVSPRTNFASVRHISPLFVYFPADQENDTISKAVKFENLSELTHRIEFSQLSSPFTGDSSSLTLSPLSNASIFIQFTLPDADSTFLDTLKVMKNENEFIEIVLIGLENDPSQLAHTFFEQKRVTFGPAYPNPTNTFVRLSFNIIKGQYASIKIVNKNNETIRILTDPGIVYGGGIYSFIWDLYDDDNNKVAPEIYRAIIELPEDNLILHGDIKINQE